MLTIEKLRAYGADVKEGLGRCMNNEAFYLRLVNMAAGDGGFARLRDALEKGDRKAGFEAAHALKGMLGNLSLTPLSEPVSQLTELLRSEQADAGQEETAALRERIEEAFDRLQSMIHED